MSDTEKIVRIKELTPVLREAARVYYQEGREIMPNIEYDRLYDELLALENETGFRLAGTPTQTAGYEVLSELPKERHPSPMLSLDKTKSADDLISWLGGRQGVLSWKLDGITCVVTYENGVMTKAVTRGNGEIGEVVTGNAAAFINLPLSIPFKGSLVIRGEAVISYSDFNRINSEISETDAAYKNPRNLCSGSVRQLDPKVTASRSVRLIVFSLVSINGGDAAGASVESESFYGNADGENAAAANAFADLTAVPDLRGSFSARFDWLKAQGFEVVEHVLTDGNRLKEDVESFRSRIGGYDIPSDGLVLSFEDYSYGLSLGRTAKFPRNSIAFKWKDETAETVLRSIDWSASRTGLINPVAVFDPVELEGTTVSRASVHNISIVRELKLGIGDRLTVYKANMIIPQIYENLDKSDSLEIPETCPVCGGKTELREDLNAKLLYCSNPECPVKKIKSFALMVSRDALNIEGLSEMTLEKLIGEGFIREYADLFRLESHREEIAALEGFGPKSADNLIAAAKKASVTEIYRMIYGLGINGIGLAGAKTICARFSNDLDRILSATPDELLAIDGIGPVLAENFSRFFAVPENASAARSLASCLEFTDAGKSPSDSDPSALKFKGMTFVITGDLSHFKNRGEAKDLIESLGGKVAGSVSSKTTCLINNDALSSSSKNKKARALGIPVITEEEFLEMTQLSREL